MRYKNNNCTPTSALETRKNLPDMNRPLAEAITKTLQYLANYRIGLCVIFSMLLVACGGGGGDISRNNPTTPTTPTSTLTITLSIADANTQENSNELSAETPLIVSAVVTDQDGQVVADALVTYSFNLPDLAVFDPASGTALTNAQGISAIGVTVGTIAGDGLITALLQSGETAQIGFSSAGNLNDGVKQISLNITSKASGEEDNQLTVGNPLIIGATVLNPQSDPVSDELITFTFSQPGLATFLPESGTALTMADGSADIEVVVGQSAGAGKVIATLSTGETAQIGFNSAGGGIVVAEQPATLDFFTSSLILASSGSDEIELIALVKDESNILMEGVQVAFSADSGELRIAQATSAADGTARAFLTSQNNPENRAIVVTAEAGSLRQELSVDVSGTTIDINAPGSIVLNDDAEITLLLANSDGVGIAFEPVTLTSQIEGVLSDPTPITDQTGQVTITYNAVQSGNDVIMASALNATASQTIIIQEDEFSFSRSSVEQDVPLNTDETITITWLKDGVPFVGGNVLFTTTRGTLSAVTGATDANGQVSVTVSSTSAGNAIIGAQGTDSEQNVVNARTNLEFVATEVASIIVAASPNSIGPNGQKSTITAVIRDPIGNLVKGVTVGFTAEDVSGGELFPPVAVTNANGLASTVFTSNTVTSEDAIIITATEASSALSATAEVTVADRAQFISLGTGNQIETPDQATYLKRFAVFVTDANSNPVENVDLTVTGTPVKYTELLEPNATVSDANYNVSKPAFYKGYWEAFPSADAFEFWVSNRTVGCPNEDIDDDAILDTGEDANGDGNLTPGNIVAIDGNVTTDSNGQAEIAIRYPKTFAAWSTIKITVSTLVAGSENRVSQFYDLGASAEDLSIESTPPNQNPFGDGRNFVQDPANPGQFIDDGRGLSCDNSL